MSVIISSLQLDGSAAGGTQPLDSVYTTKAYLLNVALALPVEVTGGGVARHGQHPGVSLFVPPRSGDYLRVSRLRQQRILGRLPTTNRCSYCHDVSNRIGAELTATVLAGCSTVGVLDRYLCVAMPRESPGSLTDAEYEYPSEKVQVEGFIRSVHQRT